MDTGIVARVRSGMHTILVLTGSTTRDQTERLPYRPQRIIESIADLIRDIA